MGENVLFRYPSHTNIDFTRPCLIEFGSDIDVNDNFTILTHDFGSFVFRNLYKDFVNSSGKVRIGNNIVFGRNVTVLKGVTIGDNCVIGLGSVVTNSIPSNSVVAGCPARVICSIEDYYKKRKEKSKKEAIEYGVELARVIGGVDKLKIDSFPEEWVQFLSLEEYELNPSIRPIVDMRLKEKVNINEFLERPRPFQSFTEFRNALNKEFDNE